MPSSRRAPAKPKPCTRPNANVSFQRESISSRTRFSRPTKTIDAAMSGSTIAAGMCDEAEDGQRQGQRVRHREGRHGLDHARQPSDAQQQRAEEQQVIVAGQDVPQSQPEELTRDIRAVLRKAQIHFAVAAVEHAFGQQRAIRPVAPSAVDGGHARASPEYLDRTVSREPLTRSNATTTLAPASPSVSCRSTRPATRTPSTPDLDGVERERIELDARARRRASGRHPRASDSVATTRPDSTCTSSALRPGSCARCRTGMPESESRRHQDGGSREVRQKDD